MMATVAKRLTRSQTVKNPEFKKIFGYEPELQKPALAKLKDFPLVVIDHVEKKIWINSSSVGNEVDDVYWTNQSPNIASYIDNHGMFTIVLKDQTTVLMDKVYGFTLDYQGERFFTLATPVPYTFNYSGNRCTLLCYVGITELRNKTALFGFDANGYEGPAKIVNIEFLNMTNVVNPKYDEAVTTSLDVYTHKSAKKLIDSAKAATKRPQQTEDDYEYKPPDDYMEELAQRVAEQENDAASHLTSVSQRSVGSGNKRFAMDPTQVKSDNKDRRRIDDEIKKRIVVESDSESDVVITVTPAVALQLTNQSTIPTFQQVLERVRRGEEVAPLNVEPTTKIQFKRNERDSLAKRLKRVRLAIQDDVDAEAML